MRDRNIPTKGSKKMDPDRVNRQPSLHEYSTFCMKLRIHDDYTIHFPIQVCEPLNAKQNWCFKIPLNAGNTR